jgi:hypothetical protein
MVGLLCLVSQCAKLHVAGWMWAVFTCVYLESCIWPVVKQQCVDVCTELSQLTSDNETFLSRVITGNLASCNFFLFPKVKFKLKGCWFDTIKEIQAKLQSVWHTYRKGLPGSIPKMEERVGLVSTCGRELLQGWWWPIGLMVSFMIFTASVWNILDTTLYLCCYMPFSFVIMSPWRWCI